MAQNKLVAALRDCYSSYIYFRNGKSFCNQSPHCSGKNKNGTGSSGKWRHWSKDVSCRLTLSTVLPFFKIWRNFSLFLFWLSGRMTMTNLTTWRLTVALRNIFRSQIDRLVLKDRGILNFQECLASSEKHANIILEQSSWVYNLKRGQFSNMSVWHHCQIFSYASFDRILNTLLKSITAMLAFVL